METFIKENGKIFKVTKTETDPQHREILEDRLMRANMRIEQATEEVTALQAELDELNNLK